MKKRDDLDFDEFEKILKESGIVFAETDMTTSAALTELAMNNVFAMSAPVLRVQDNFYTVNEIMDGDFVTNTPQILFETCIFFSTDI